MTFIKRLCLPLLLLGVMMATAHAAGATPANITWQQLAPGTDWSSQILNELFPLTGNPNTPGLGGEQTVIGIMLGDLNALVMLIAMAYVAYSTIIEIHRGAETGRVLSEKTSSWSPVRMGFAAIMMIPLATGFSVGQGGVIKIAGWAIGGATTIYNNAIQAIGPQGLPITKPQIPNVEPLVAELINSEVCRALINDAANNDQEVPPPGEVTGGSGSSGFIDLNYSLIGNQTGSNPTCGSIEVKTGNGAQTIDGVNTNMSANILADINYVLGTTIRPAAQTAANTWWTTRNSAALQPLWATYVTATNQLVNLMTTAATNVIATLRTAQGTQGNLDTAEQQMENLGWAGAGAYFWKIAQINGATLSMLGITLGTPAKPSYSGIGPAIASDIAPAMIATAKFMQEIENNATTNDSASPPSGIGDKAGTTPTGPMAFLLKRMSINQILLNNLTQALAPTAGVWQDPFASMAIVGSKMIVASTGAMVAIGGLRAANAKGLWARIVRVFPEGEAAAVAAKVFDGGVLGSFVFTLCMALLVPGLILAFVMPMIPLTMWIAGVASWFILVIEAMIAVPLWMLAHMTYQGEGFHGRAYYGYSLLFNVLFRPVLMLFGLMLGYWVFTVMSWLTFETFNLGADFVFQQGYVLTNILGVIVLLAMLVVIEMTWAVMGFRMISQVPYQVIKWVGFAPASRVDMEQFALATTTQGTRGTVGEINRVYQGEMDARLASAGISRLAGGGGSGRLSGPASQNRGGRGNSNNGNNSSGASGTDATLNAGTDIIPPAEDAAD
ncbi:MAG: DotA/TraY family protein [Acidiphilium sp.]|nr:DotA/TraY family protein [Acidiphilium sp.]MDD4937048.1 DotA/TraY family protein [Acidiphilium sp.]